MTLGGGDVHALSVGDFLDVAQGLLVEQFQSIGMKLFEALDAAAEFGAGYTGEEEELFTAGGNGHQDSTADLAREEAALKELDNMIRGMESRAR